MITFPIKYRIILVTFVHRHIGGVKDNSLSVVYSEGAICVCSTHGTYKSYSFIPGQADLHSDVRVQPILIW